MIEFHKEYQRVFGQKASICTIMKNRITHMNPPMPDSICKEEMQNATIENDVIIEYITDAQGRKVKRLKPLLIKSEHDGEYTQHIHSDDNLQMYQKIISYKKEKQRLTHIAELFPLTHLVMIEQ